MALLVGGGRRRAAHAGSSRWHRACPTCRWSRIAPDLRAARAGAVPAHRPAGGAAGHRARRRGVRRGRGRDERRARDAAARPARWPCCWACSWPLLVLARPAVRRAAGDCGRPASREAVDEDDRHERLLRRWPGRHGGDLDRRAGDDRRVGLPGRASGASSAWRSTCWPAWRPATWSCWRSARCCCRACSSRSPATRVGQPLLAWSPWRCVLAMAGARWLPRGPVVAVPVAVLVAGTAAFALGGAVVGTLLPQIGAPLLAPGLDAGRCRERHPVGAARHRAGAARASCMARRAAACWPARPAPDAGCCWAASAAGWASCWSAGWRCWWIASASCSVDWLGIVR